MFAAVTGGGGGCSCSGVFSWKKGLLELVDDGGDFDGDGGGGEGVGVAGNNGWWRILL